MCDFGIESFGYLDIKYPYCDEELRVYYGESEEEATDHENTIVYEFIKGQKEYRLTQRDFDFFEIIWDKPKRKI